MVTSIRILFTRAIRVGRAITAGARRRRVVSTVEVVLSVGVTAVAGVLIVRHGGRIGAMDTLLLQCSDVTDPIASE